MPRSKAVSWQYQAQPTFCLYGRVCRFRKRLCRLWSIHESVANSNVPTQLTRAVCLFLAAVFCGGCVLPLIPGSMPATHSAGDGCGNCVGNEFSPQNCQWPQLPVFANATSLCSCWLATPHGTDVPVGPVEAPPPPRFHPVPTQPVFASPLPLP